MTYQEFAVQALAWNPEAIITQYGEDEADFSATLDDVDITITWYHDYGFVCHIDHRYDGIGNTLQQAYNEAYYAMVDEAISTLEF